MIKIQASPSVTSDPAAHPAPLCAHCAAPVSGACSMVLHVIDNPPHGRPQINAFTVFQFCGDTCREAWWAVPASPDAPCFANPEDVRSHGGHELACLVIHNDRGARHPIPITVDDGSPLAEHTGVLRGMHVFDHPEHIEAWWRGEIEVEVMPVPMMEAPGV